MVTAEDLTEEIFGSIRDEYDEAASFSSPSERSVHEDAVEDEAPFIIKGTVRLSELTESLNISAESDYHDTIGGYIMEAAGEIPPCGYSLAIEPYIFTVVKREANRIDEVEVRKRTFHE